MSNTRKQISKRDAVQIPGGMMGPEADFVRWINDPNQETFHPQRADPYSILGMPAYWAGVTIVSDRCGNLPLELWKPDGDKRTPLTNNPVRKLCCKSFTPWCTSKAGIKALVANSLRFGNSLALIHRDNGVPEELTILNPDMVTILPYQSPDGRIVPFYRLTILGQVTDYAWTDIIHIKGLNQTCLEGFSVAWMLNTALSLGLNIYRHSEKYFERNCPMNILLTAPAEAKIDEIKAKSILKTFKENLASGNPGMVTGGITASSFNDNAAEAQLTDAKNFSLVDVANAINGIPVSCINGQSIVSYQSLEADERRLLTNGLNPFLFQIETEFSNKLLTTDEIDQGIEFQFDRSSLDCPAPTERTTNVLGLLKAGVISKHESRLAMGYSGPAPAIEVEPLAADIVNMVGTVITGDEARLTLGLTGPAPEPLPPPSPETPPNEPDGDDEALRSIAKANLDRLFERLKRSSGSVSPKWCGSHRKVFLKSFPNKTGPINRFFRGLKQELEATSKDDHEKIIKYRTENNTLLEDIINE